MWGWPEEGLTHRGAGNQFWQLVYRVPCCTWLRAEQHVAHMHLAPRRAAHCTHALGSAQNSTLHTCRPLEQSSSLACLPPVTQAPGRHAGAVLCIICPMHHARVGDIALAVQDIHARQPVFSSGAAEGCSWSAKPEGQPLHSAAHQLTASMRMPALRSTRTRSRSIPHPCTPAAPWPTAPLQGGPPHPGREPQGTVPGTSAPAGSEAPWRGTAGPPSH